MIGSECFQGFGFRIFFECPSTAFSEDPTQPILRYKYSQNDMAIAKNAEWPGQGRSS